MSGDIVFHNAGRKSWTVRNGMFRVVLGTTLACYLDEMRAPAFAQFCRAALGPWLHEYWPDRYSDEQTKLFFLVMDEDIPRAEYPAIIEALGKLADGFAQDTIDPRVSWNRESDFVDRTRELIALMRASLAAQPIGDGIKRDVPAG